MSLRAFYEKIGGDYEGIKSRLYNDEIILKFILKFQNEKSYEELMATVEENDVANAILAAHKMKGVVSNLSFDRLLHILTELLAWLRQENQDIINAEMIAQVKEEYQKTIFAIQELQK